MKPKLVITLTDNSKEFSIISKYFDNEVPFTQFKELIEEILN